MGKNSKIEWTDHTFNPWEGCTKVSPGCQNCYAEARNHRFGLDNWGPGKKRRRTSAANWKLPLRWNNEAAKAHERSVIDICEIGGGAAMPPRRPRVFCASLADWLDDEVPIAWLADLLNLIHDTPNLDWLLLTKRPENFFKRIRQVRAMAMLYLTYKYGADDNLLIGHPDFEFLRNQIGSESKEEIEAKKQQWGGISGMLCGWTYSDVTNEPDQPPANVWIGTTVEDQERADQRIPELLKIPAKVRFLSCEPLLGPVDLSLWLPDQDADQDTTAFHSFHHPEDSLHWIIAGGESGPRARPSNPDWFRSLRDQCQAAGVPFFFKQWGEWLPMSQDSDPMAKASHASRELLHGGIETRLIGKKAAGRVLDGRTWDQFPTGK